MVEQPGVDYSQIFPDPVSKPKEIRVVRANGEEIERLRATEKNVLYAKARILKEQIRHALLTHSEHWNPTEHNVQKYLATEGNTEFKKLIGEFRNLMMALGADPKDYSTEKLRKGR